MAATTKNTTKSRSGKQIQYMSKESSTSSSSGKMNCSICVLFRTDSTVMLTTTSRTSMTT